MLEPPERWPRPQFGALWAHRDLAYFLSWRDVKIRYKQSFVGIGWAVVQPLGSMLALTFVFDGIANVPSEGIPYPVFVLAGLIPWAYFSTSISASSSSLVGNLTLVTKVYFPRIVLPVSSVLTPLVDLVIATLLLLGLMAIYGIFPRPSALLLPLLVLFIMLAALGVGLLLASINAKYRDVVQTLSFVLQIWLFLTPVVYPGSLVPESGPLRFIYGLNPMVGAIELFRWAVVGTPPPPLSFVVSSVCVVLILLVLGSVYFAKTEQHFADVI